jgi:Rrf2 family nitric oxide-sensitive transcriptional repressor
VHQLGVAGDVVTVRGRHGGLRLAKPASAINIGEVVRRTEPDMALVACFDTMQSCVIQDGCVLQHVLGDALAAFLAVLDGYTLADLAAPRHALAGMLGMPPSV